MEEKLFGYAGKLLFVNLSTREIREEKLERDDAQRFLGGYGYGAKVLFNKMDPKADPLGPDNILGFVAGPLTGTGAFMSGRFMVICKSPVTMGWNEANGGGYFGPEMKKAGFDGIFVSGQSEKPVYLFVDDGKVEIRDASELWGLDIKEMEAKLRVLTGYPKMQSAAIGPAGEHLSLISAIMNDGHRAAARGGLGAVMGSKKLKAIVVHGTGKIEVADVEKFRATQKKIADAMRKPENDMYAYMGQLFGTLGTGGTTEGSILSGDSPVKNWGGVGIEDFGAEAAKKVGTGSFDDKYSVKKYGCANCAIVCGAVYKVEDGKWPVGDTERPEYETMAAFGSNCMNSDVESIIKCNEICNRSGLDTISTGSTIAWVMENYEHGKLTKDQLDGLEAKWGDPKVIVALTEKMANNEGVGQKLQHGQKAAAKAFGLGDEFFTTSMGIEHGMHDARLAKGWIRSFQYDPAPGRHTTGGASSVPVDSPNWGEADVAMMAVHDTISAAGVCMFGPFAFPVDYTYELIEAVTGYPFNAQTAHETGQRIFTMRHAFNLREGLKRSDFETSPRLFGKPPFKSGPTANVTLDNEGYADLFFTAMHWDKDTLYPSKERLEQLGGLEAVIESLYS